MRRLSKACLLAFLAAVAIGVVSSRVVAQQATRLFATLSADLASGTSTPVTCTASGSGCFLDVVLNGALANLQTFSFGTGTATPFVEGTLTSSVTQTCTGANTTETDLFSYTLPASSLTVNARGVRIVLFGNFGATGNTKTVKLYFGATQINSDATTSNGGIFRYTAYAFRTGAATQYLFSEGIIGTTPRWGTTPTSGAETLTSNVVIRATGTNGTAAANDICGNAFHIETIR